VVGRTGSPPGRHPARSEAKSQDPPRPGRSGRQPRLHAWILQLRAGWHLVGAPRMRASTLGRLAAWPLGRLAVRLHAWILRLRAGWHLVGAPRMRASTLGRLAAWPLGRLAAWPCVCTRGSCDCAQDDTWLALRGCGPARLAAWPLGRASARVDPATARRMTPGWRSTDAGQHAWPLGRLAAWPLGRASAGTACAVVRFVHLRTRALCIRAVVRLCGPTARRQAVILRAAKRSRRIQGAPGDGMPPRPL